MGKYVGFCFCLMWFYSFGQGSVFLKEDLYLFLKVFLTLLAKNGGAPLDFVASKHVRESDPTLLGLEPNVDQLQFTHMSFASNKSSWLDVQESGRVGKCLRLFLKVRNMFEGKHGCVAVWIAICALKTVLLTKLWISFDCLWAMK